MEQSITRLNSKIHFSNLSNLFGSVQMNPGELVHLMQFVWPCISLTLVRTKQVDQEPPEKGLGQLLSGFWQVIKSIKKVT